MHPLCASRESASVTRDLARVVCALLVAGGPGVGGAAPLDAVDIPFRCPTRLLRPPVADALPQGWILHAEPGALTLERAGFYDGDPVGLGALAPDSTHRTGLVETSTWTFDATDSARVWLGCLYRDASTVVARPLPGGLHQCTTVLRLTRLGDPAEAVSVRCR